MARPSKTFADRFAAQHIRATLRFARVAFGMCTSLACSSSSQDVQSNIGGAGLAVVGSAGTSGDGGNAAGGSASVEGGASGTGSSGSSGSAGAFDVSSLFAPNGGPSACPSLAQTGCWQQLLREYVTAASCFTHRSSCDATADGGDASECGVWADASRMTCNWPDGTRVDHDAASNTDILKSPEGTECYRKQFTTINGESGVLLTFGTRVYTVTLDATAMTATFSCPDGRLATANEAEFQACNLRGICCSFPSPACAGSSSL